jgi:ABC-2 type transport system permease protein
MAVVFSLFARELRGYFVSPIAYVVIIVFLLITGWFFFTPFFLLDQSSLRAFFSLLPFVFALVVPAVTMRLFAEEKSVGSIETLLTMPVTIGQVVAGKFLAASAFIAAMLLPTLAYPTTAALLGELDIGPVVGGYVGAVLLGAAYAAIGLFCSSLTHNQIIAFILAAAICFGLTTLDKVLFFLPQTILGVVQFLGADTHFQNFAKGVIDSRDLLYFGSLCFTGVYGACLATEPR